MRCKLCSRDAVKNGFCDLHSMAYDNVVRGYEAWKKALEISWKDYLREIVKNPLTGMWAKEVAEHLMKIEAKPNGAEG